MKKIYLFTFFILFATGIYAQAPIFIKFSNSSIIKGTSLNATFKGMDGWSEIFDSAFRVQKPFNEGIINNGTFQFKRPQAMEFSFQKNVDTNSPTFENFILKGLPIPKVEVNHTKQAGSGMIVAYLVLEFENVLINNITRKGNLETVSLIYTKMRVKYKKQNPITGQFETSFTEFAKDFQL